MGEGRGGRPKSDEKWWGEGGAVNFDVITNDFIYEQLLTNVKLTDFGGRKNFKCIKRGSNLTGKIALSRSVKLFRFCTILYGGCPCINLTNFHWMVFHLGPTLVWAVKWHNCHNRGTLLLCSDEIYGFWQVYTLCAYSTNIIFTSVNPIVEVLWYSTYT